MGKRIKSEKKGGGGGEESKFIEEYTPLIFQVVVSLSILSFVIIIVIITYIATDCFNCVVPNFII